MVDLISPFAPEALLKHGHDGWWPYLPGREPSTEATAWCAMACRKDPAAARKSLEYLLSIQNKDGGWSTRAGTEPSDWTSGLALLAVQVLQRSLAEIDNENSAPLLKRTKDAIADGAVHLLRSRADFITDAARITMFIFNGADFDYPRGWAWTPDTFHWIEPTSHAVLALKMTPLATEKRYQLALKEANDYYFEKICKSGGWNYGVPVSVGAPLPSQTVPTAWALIALHEVHNEKTRKAVELLNTTNDVTTKTLQAKALSILALAAHGVDVKDRVQALSQDFTHHERMSHNLMIAGMCSIACALPDDGNPLLPKAGP